MNPSSENPPQSRTGPRASAADPVRIPIKAVPGASRDQIVGPLGGRLKIKVAAPPEGGKANAAICALVAAALGLKARQVVVVAGHGSAEKVLEIRALESAEVKRRLGLG
jgi:uncharacterized protein (TIGR00251 family)